MIDLARYLGSALLLVFIALLAGVAALPPYLLGSLVDAHFGRLAAVGCLPLGYLLWGTGFCLLIVLYKRLTFYRVSEGTYPLFSLPIIQWAITARMVDVAHVAFVRHLVGTPYITLWFRLLGAKIGRRATINSCDLSDWDLLEIGDDTMLGAGVVVIAHVAEMGKLKLKRVKLGASCTVGRSSVIFPGVVMEDRAVLGAYSLVTKDKVLPAGTIWAGVPAAFLRQRGEKDAQPPAGGAEKGTNLAFSAGNPETPAFRSPSLWRSQPKTETMESMMRTRILSVVSLFLVLAASCKPDPVPAAGAAGASPTASVLASSSASAAGGPVAAPMAGVITYNIGTPAQIQTLYPDKSWVPPYYLAKGHYLDIAKTIEDFTNQSLIRDGIITTSVKYDASTGNVTITTPVPSSLSAAYAVMQPAFMNNLHAVQALNGVNLCKSTSGCWDPHPGNAPWAMFLPFGMPIVNQMAVTLLDYPPSTSMQQGDYLNNFTMIRWGEVMTRVGIWNNYLYETTVDSRPIAAPGSGQSNYLPSSSTYFNAQGTNHYYVTPMIALLDDPPSNTSASFTRPITVLGTPARTTWAGIIGKPTVNVLDVGQFTLPGATKNSSWVAGNHPDVTTYQCCPGDPNSNCGCSTPGNCELVQDEQIDFQVLCITKLLSENPSARPMDIKALCFQMWGRPLASLSPPDKHSICEQAKLDYDYTANGACKSEADADAFCTAYNDNPCPPNVYTCELPKGTKATPRVREAK